MGTFLKEEKAASNKLGRWGKVPQRPRKHWASGGGVFQVVGNECLAFPGWWGGGSYNSGTDQNNTSGVKGTW